MKFIKKSKIEIKTELEEANIFDVQGVLDRLEERAGELGSTTQNLQKFSFSLEIKNEDKKCIVSRIDVI